MVARRYRFFDLPMSRNQPGPQRQATQLQRTAAVTLHLLRNRLPHLVRSAAKPMR